jgi:hypothetical protein
VFYFLAFALVQASGEQRPSGAKSVAMGGISVASTDFWSVGNNPAGLAWLGNIGAGFSCDNRFMMAELSAAVAGGAVPFNFGTFGFSLKRFGNELYNELGSGIAFARKFGKKFSAGVRFDYLITNLSGAYGRKNSLSCRIGLIYHTENQLSLGVYIVNPVPVKMTEQPDEYLPSRINLGLDWQLSTVFLISLELEKDMQNTPVLRSGCEYRIAPPLKARIGLTANPFVFSFGFGIEAGRIIFDIASFYHPDLGFSPAGSLVYVFHR